MDICIIGAGPSGLCAAKEIQERNPDCRITLFEQAPTLGGTFSCAYKGLRLVNNPLLVAFSDFLPDECIGDLRMWTAEAYVDYLRRYADANRLHRLIRYGCSVSDVAWEDDRWRVDFMRDGKTHTAQFDYLVVCSGSNSVPCIPTFAGQDTFTGSILHGSAIRDPSQLKGLRVVYVGLGETASDLVLLASDFARSSTVSVRRWPGYLIPRYHDRMPTDLDTSRAHHGLPKGLDDGPLSFALRLKRRLEYRSIRSPEDRAIQAHADALNTRSPVAALGPFRRTATKNCGFLRAHLEGKADLKPGIIELQGDRVRYADGTTSRADILVCCTGYHQRFAFLPESVAQHVTSSSNLYDYVFVPGMEGKLAFVGFVRPAVGTVPVAAELQSRYLALVLDGSVSLPGHDAMAHAIRKQKAFAQTTFPADVERIGHLIDYYPYLSGIARKIGVFPRLRSLFFRDIKLWYKIHFAFLCPGIFRLHGPGAKPQRVTPVLKALPTMKRRVLLVEALLYVACWTLSRLGFRHLRPSP